MNKMDSNTIPEKEPKQPIADDEAQIHPTSSQHIFSDAPDGGLEAWLVAAGAFCVFFAGLGFVNSNGVFIEYYLSHQLSHRSADDVSWIASLSTFIQFASGLVGGPLFDRYGAWVCSLSAFFFDAYSLYKLVTSYLLYIDPSTKRLLVHPRCYADEPVPRILALHVGSGRPTWHRYGRPHVPYHRGSIPVL